MEAQTLLGAFVCPSCKPLLLLPSAASPALSAALTCLLVRFTGLLLLISLLGSGGGWVEALGGWLGVFFRPLSVLSHTLVPRDMPDLWSLVGSVWGLTGTNIPRLHISAPVCPAVDHTVFLRPCRRLARWLTFGESGE